MYVCMWVCMYVCAYMCIFVRLMRFFEPACLRVLCRTFDLERGDLEAYLKPYVERFFPLLDPEPVIRETCLYTMTPEEDFILDFVPGTHNVIIGAGEGRVVCVSVCVCVCV